MEEVAKQKAWYKKWWGIAVIIVVAMSVIGGLSKRSGASPDASATSASKPTLDIHAEGTDGGMYYYEKDGVAAMFKFKKDGSVIWVSQAGTMKFASTGKYRVDAERGRIIFSDWDEAVHPKGDGLIKHRDGEVIAIELATGAIYKWEPK